MEDKLINEVNRIKSMMIINESSLINEITLPRIIKELMSVLKSEEKILISKFLKNEIIDEVEKAAFSKFANSAKGKLFISNLKNRVNNEIFDTLKQKRALKNIEKMEQSANDWKAVKSSVKPPVKPPVELGTISDEAKALFGNINKKITPEQAALLDNASKKIYNGVQKLNQKELLVLTDELRSVGVSIQKAIDKLNSSKILAQQQKAKLAQQSWDNLQKQIKVVTDNVMKFPLWKSIKSIIKISLGVFALAIILGVAFTFKNTKIGVYLGDLISNIPNVLSPANPTNGNTPNTPPAPQKGKYD
jgi:hypothetical protein